MCNPMSNAVPKVHPATREMLPEDPLEMQAFEMSGDPHLMLTLLVEEYARIGWGADAILKLALDPEYLAFDGLRNFFGAEKMEREIRQILTRCGVVRVTAKETEPLSEKLVQIEPLK